jgi:hypothetical protein
VIIVAFVVIAIIMMLAGGLAMLALATVGSVTP